jgi:hypothetical protein
MSLPDRATARRWTSLPGCILLCFLCCSLGASPGLAADERPTFEETVAGLERVEGLLASYRDPVRGKIWLELPAPQEPGGEIGRYLYVEGLLTGLGSNPVGLDRGQLGETRLIAFRRVGGRVVVEQLNTVYRATSDHPDELRAVRQSFATSVLWGTEIAAEGRRGELLVDFTSFVVRDAHGVAPALAAADQGPYSLDAERSAVDLDACLAFPENLEFEALLTFAGDDPGPHVRQVTPEPRSITLVQHHSILRLPDAGYRPRRFDPRAGSYAIRFQDYGSALEAPLARRWIVRHRLEKLHPERASSPVREPIVYYVDGGTPEPVRGALLDGARWWSRAFEAAGFEDAFRVEVLPDGVHPLDARYNVIQWVHRSTRGWSYGGGVVDPRTGEMIKGHVSLGSLRVRQDRLLFEGLLGTERTGSGAPDDPVELALARLRQLSAHEVGHTLGLSHNFAASALGRASVMDYPAPLVRVGPDGELDATEAYGTGVGAWDRLAIRYAYAEFTPGADEDAELARILAESLAGGLFFLGDADARPAGAAHPLANLWDNGADPVAELEQVLAVRSLALARFGERNIASGRPLALLQEVLAPLYFHHRYQLEAAAKSVGGLEYRHALRGDGQPPARPVPADRQRAALEAVLHAIDVDALDLPDSVLSLLLPRPPEHGGNRELFATRTSPAFDALGAAASACSLVVDALLQPERCGRLVDQHRRDESLPGMQEVVDALAARAFAEPKSARARAIATVVRQRVVAGLVALSADERAAETVRATADATLGRLERLLSTATDDAAALRLATEISRYLARPYGASPFSAAPPAPPGSPIGAAWAGGCSRQARP